MTLEDNKKLHDKINKQRLKYLRSIGYKITVAKKESRCKYSPKTKLTKHLKIKNTDTGEIYENINEIVDKMGIKYGSIWCQLNGYNHLVLPLVYLDEK